MKLDALLSFLADEFSGLRAKNAVADITGFHRIQASPGYDDAIAYVAGKLDILGIGHQVWQFPADGETATFGWISPPGWVIRSGSLQQITPQQKRLAAFDIVKISVLGQSSAGDWEGEVVHVGAGDSEACFEGHDLQGKFILTHGRPASMLQFLKGTGVAGIILYPTVERAAPSYDLVQYGGLFPKADELSWLPMGFSISRRAAEALLEDLNKGTVRVRGQVDAEFVHNPMQVLEATIPGSDATAGEVLLTAHLCHPAQSANDNASGCGVLLEIARVLATMATRGELIGSVRLVWVPEFNGTIPWVAARKDTLKNTCLALNLDMVGQSPELIGEPLRVFRIPNSHPSFFNACFEPLLKLLAADERTFAAQGSRRVLHWILDLPTGGSDHLVLQAPPADIPTAMLGHDDPFWHTDQDTLEKVDPTRLKHVGMLAALLATLPTWGRDEPEMLAEWLLAFSQCAVVEAAALARRATDGTMKHVLLDAALRVELERAKSLAQFLGQDVWDPARCFESLRATRRALSQVGAGVVADTEPTDSGAPVRLLAGPVRYECLLDLPPEDREFLEDKFAINHGAPPHLLLNLADGSRTISDITASLSLDLQQLFTREDVEHALELLARVGYVKMP